jgi:tetratricopeptide (TPR) repeat protein
MKFILLALVVITISACQSLGFNRDELVLDQNFLAAIQPAILMTRTEIAPTPSVQVVIQSYKNLLPLLKEPETKMRVLHRLADLKLMEGENLMAEQAVDELDVAISAYQDLLVKYPKNSDNDHVYYQLAKTYDLKGNAAAYLKTLGLLVKKHPKSMLMTEVQFRRGELLFTQNNYESAKNAFNAVISNGQSSFLVNAYYMLGWSQFKLSQYTSALISYASVLDIVLPNDYRVDLADQKYHTMLEDLLHVMGLSLSYLDKENSLEQLFVDIGSKPYEILVYDRYSDLLIEKEQYTDALNVYRRYIRIHPNSVWSPQYQVNIIYTLKLAGFNRDIYAEKVRFIDVYGIGQSFWIKHSPEELEFTRTQLVKLLPELANYHYVRAQKSLKKKNNKAVNDNFTLAARFYAEFVATFPKHVDVANSLFLLGESYLQLKHWELAINSFNHAAYDYENFSKASEAGYASILAYVQYAKNWPKVTENTKSSPVNVKQSENTLALERLRSEQQINRLRFVKHHSQDKRAIDVLFIATSTDFEAQRFDKAIINAQQLLDWSQVLGEGKKPKHKFSPKNSMLTEANLIKAHSFFALEQYKFAELTYLSALKTLPIKDKRRPGVIENLAASVFKQAEALLAKGKTAQAIDEFLRVALVAPTSKLRASAEYDAANYLLELKNWPKMIGVLTDFRKRYPMHSLINTLPAKLALAYRETMQWELAAAELKTMYSQAKSGEEKQNTLYVIAELYDKAENKQQALLSYRQYANTYAEPADAYMEAAYRLSVLYNETDQPLKRRFWLMKQMKAVDRAPKKADDRMRYLAAGASAVLANDAFIQYKRIKLKLPLNVTMVKKTKALDKAVKAYQKTASYSVSVFSTEAGFMIADIYAQLSVDLMASDRPSGLNELELEQYDILLEEQAYPFEDSAIDIHSQNVSRSWVGIYDDWVKNSFKELKSLLPGRYNKEELMKGAVNELY